MNMRRGTTRVPAVAVLLSSLALAACGPGPAPAEQAAGALAGDAGLLQPASPAASAPMAVAIPRRDAAAAPRNARASDVAPGGACPSSAGEPAPIDGGREVTPEPDADGAVQDVAPAPVQPRSPEAG